MDGAMDVMATELRPVQGVALAKGLENLFVFGMDLRSRPTPGTNIRMWS
jgi:hypothetical protein